jgi:hypothetical protein
MKKIIYLSFLVMIVGFTHKVNAQCDGGTVSEEMTGLTQVYTCPGDGMADVIFFSNETMATDNYAYVITDTNNVILGLPPGNSNDFEEAGEGICRVWGLSYTGSITAMAGDTASKIELSDDCYDLSDNYITIIRDMPEGGTVSEEGTGADMVYTCTNDGMADIVKFDHITNSMAKYTYVITDEQNNILGLPPADSNDFDVAPAGVCRVWGLSYTGNILAEVGDNAAQVDLTDDCFDLSDNYISVVREEVDGGRVYQEETEDTIVYTCVGDEMADYIKFDSTTMANANYTYVITDDQNNILGLPPVDSNDFEPAGIGVCRVWGLSFTGDILAEVGDNAAEVELSSRCFELSSNFIEVIRDMPDGGMVSEEGTGEDTVYTCTNDGIADIVKFDHTTNSMSKYTYVITDDQNNILGLPPADSNDFDMAPAGICRVWGLSYTGNILAEVGDNAAQVDLTDGCFDLSINYITVIREAVDGGRVYEEETQDTVVYTCVGDEIADYITFEHTTTANANYTYVITDDQNNILGLPSVDSNNFEAAGEGICRVWGLSYTGEITAEAGDNAGEVELSSRCFELSSNFIEVIRDMPDGGMVSEAETGNDTVYTCPGDGIADVIHFEYMTESMSKYTFVITDDQNNILGLPPADSNDFEGAAEGVCRVWGLSYTGDITAMTGDNAAEVNLTNDCFNLSDNYITVIRDMPDGGTVSEAGTGNDTVYTCPGDGMADVIHFEYMTESMSKYTFVITDDQNNILGLPPGTSNDFEGAGEGVCRVWGLSYTGDITAMMGDNAAEIDLTDDCFNLSDNYITVIRADVDGGTVAEAGTDATEITVTAGDGDADIIEFSHTTSSSLANYAYVITDENNEILGLPPGNSNDFEEAGEGVCRVWGLSYTGNIVAQPGDNAATTTLTDACFELSDNFIEVTRLNATGIFNNHSNHQSVKIYPSMTVDFVTVSVEQLPSDAEITVFSIDGSVIETQQLVKTSVKLDVNKYNPGMYIIQIQSSEVKYSGRFIKK